MTSQIRVSVAQSRRLAGHEACAASSPSQHRKGEDCGGRGGGWATRRVCDDASTGRAPQKVGVDVDGTAVAAGRCVEAGSAVASYALPSPPACCVGC